MEFTSEMTSWLLLLPYVALVLLLGLECWIPFRSTTQTKFPRVATNLTIAGSNAVIVNLLFGGLLLAWAQRAPSEGWGMLSYMGLGLTGNIVASVLLLDLVSYGIHRLYHRVPLLWRLHRAHHSDLDIDATTSLRFHLGESVISVGVKAGSVAVLGVPWLGLVVYEMAFQIVGLYSHANVCLPDSAERRIRTVIISPQMHWIHHSRLRVDHNANFGAIFSGWDRVMGTYRVETRREDIPVGLDEYPLAEHTTLVPFLQMPFGAACRPGPHGM